jgi:hypothetical protein
MVGFRTLGVVACLALAQAQGQVSQVRELRATIEARGAPFWRLRDALLQSSVWQTQVSRALLPV